MTQEKEINDFVTKTIDNTKLCIFNDRTMFNLKDIDFELLKKMLNSNFLSNSDMRALICLVQMILQQNNTTSDNLPKLDSKISKYLKNVQKMGVFSAQGFIFYVDVISKGNKIILKRSQSKDTNFIRKEYVTGIKSINPLRALTPCFAMTLGGFSCIGDIKSLVGGQLCSSQKKSGSESFYTIIENIKGKTLSDCFYDKNMTPDRFIGILVHVFMSLEIAQRKCCFTHFDLHTGNVMIKNITNKISYSLINDTKEYIMSADTEIPVIIDYGLSFSVIDDFLLGDWRQFSKSAPIGRYMVPCYDMYLFLMSSTWDAIVCEKYNLALFIMSLFGLFSSDPYGIYTKYTKIKIKNVKAKDLFNMINEPLNDYCSKCLTSSLAFTTPLNFINKLYNAHSITSKYIKIVKRNSRIPINIDISSKIYCDLFKCGGSDEIYNTLRKCVVNQPSYILSVYNLYLLIEYMTKVKNDKISTFINEQIKEFSREGEKMIEYDKNVFDRDINLDVSKITGDHIVFCLLNVQLKNNKKHREFVIKTYSDNFQPLQEAYEEIQKFGKYLDIFYTIYEMKQEFRPEYANFLNRIQNIIDKVDQHDIDKVKDFYRMSISVKQYYRF